MAEFALLNASRRKEDARRNFDRELEADLTNFEVRDGELPPAFDPDGDGRPARRFDAVVLTGSPASVNDDEPWIREVESWIDDALAAGMPALGICFGHQLLADVLGGSVESMGEYEIGYHMIRHDGGLLFEGVDEWFVAFTAHSDEVVDPPPGATELAANNFSTHAFRRGRAFGVQFHPEFDRRTAETVFEYKDVDEATAERVLGQVADGDHATTADAESIFGNFEAYVERVPARAAATA